MTRIRRAAALISSWQGAALVVHNYLSQRSAPATPLIVELLDYCGEWRSFPEVFATFSSQPRGTLRHVIALLVAHTFLERVNTEPNDDINPLESWNTWSPAAAFFHFATKDGTYETQDKAQAKLVEKAKTEPAPAPTKAYDRAERTPLARPGRAGGLSTILCARRTWRRFGHAALDSDAIATLLGLTWGVQGWAQTELGPCALKTAPSGGARHPLEVYLLARAVTGIVPGCYYYDPDAHELVLVKRGLKARRLEAYLAGQSCYSQVPAVFVMTAVFARMQWRYEFPRAYRVVLLDAGHLCQTFCLVATALGLAPFCTAALADSLIERDLGLDGVTESAIYACGVGKRPDGIPWAPWPDRAEAPTVLPPKSRASGLYRLNENQIAERGARMARRDDREYRAYLREEQRSQPGCPAREVVLDQPIQATSSPTPPDR